MINYLHAVVQAFFCGVVAKVTFDINIACLIAIIMFNVLLALYQILEAINRNEKERHIQNKNS